MKCPDHHRRVLQGVGQDVLHGILLTETPWHKWPIGIKWDTWRILVAVESQDHCGGVDYVSIDYYKLEEYDENRGEQRFYGTLEEVVALIAEVVEEYVESGDLEGEVHEGETLLGLLAGDEWERPFGIDGKAIDAQAELDKAAA